MEKLKGLGNSILGNSILNLRTLSSTYPTSTSPGNFGLSTDNFKFVPNGEGGYSMNFVR